MINSLFLLNHKHLSILERSTRPPVNVRRRRPEFRHFHSKSQLTGSPHCGNPNNKNSRIIFKQIDLLLRSRRSSHGGSIIHPKYPFDM
ncbi:unnamed protein product [Nesidiocoris tenuis]|uniref:Uncharacterized protein n=1 Tax=Nesidiocoris tenuis TaxID=355587 RepID=A0A6H5GSY5_9HEMI|nr:unnamed protein product [Nesidiocoris tenuis]CAB0007454.1 unnamed protein product [Nesidiocoris tenuis]